MEQSGTCTARKSDVLYGLLTLRSMVRRKRQETHTDPTSPGAGHLVVVEGLSTCQDSDLTGKPRAGQGSPLRVAQGVPQGMGGDPQTVLTDAASSSPIARPC